MCFIGDDDNVLSFAKTGHFLTLFWEKLLYGCEHHATTRHRQQFAQLLSVRGLYRHLAENVMAALKLAEELIVKIVTICQHNKRRVLHHARANHPRGEKQHSETLAAALRVPHHARAMVSRFAAMHASGPIGANFLAHHVCIAHAAGANGLFHRSIHRMELVVARYDLVNGAAIGVFLEHNKMLE